MRRATCNTKIAHPVSLLRSVCNFHTTAPTVLQYINECRHNVMPPPLGKQPEQMLMQIDKLLQKIVLQPKKTWPDVSPTAPD